MLASAWLAAGCLAPPRPSITVYTKRDYEGKHVTLHEAYADLEEELDGFDDEISSFEIGRGVWQLCKKRNFKSCRTADRSMPDLGEWDFDNTISSIRPAPE